MDIQPRAKRSDFPKSIKTVIATRVAHHCSNPDCRALTVVPHGSPDNTVNLGVVAHITAVAEGGPRFDSSLTPIQRRGIDNAIWLCPSCHALVDLNPELYSASLLRRWKADAELRARTRYREIIDVNNYKKYYTDNQLSSEKNKHKLILDISKICLTLQENPVYWQMSENQLTSCFRDFLFHKEYIVHDEHRSGISPGGKQAGELDLDIRQNNTVPWTALEALNVDGCTNSQITYWNKHLTKLLDNYNSAGRTFLFHLSYVRCKKKEFLAIFQQFSSHIKGYSPPDFDLQYNITEEISLAEKDHPQNQFLRAMESVYDCGGIQTTVYHYFVRIGQ